MLRSLSRLRERVGERVSPQWDNPPEERALTRAFGATSPASGRGFGARGLIVDLTRAMPHCGATHACAARTDEAVRVAFAYLTASLFQRLPLSFRPLTQSCERHMALLAQALLY
ncbi:hypothetical protein ABIE85_006724 [Bradyrhizobium diazoefficiens]